MKTSITPKFIAMKKNHLFLVCQVTFIISLLLFSCKGRVNENEARGTVGKVSKYRKTQMTENDIKLRSQLTEDTAQLANTIKGLIIFDAYTKALSHDLDNHLPSLDVCECDQNDALKLEVLRNFNDYIKNNDSLIANTVNMLSDLYTKAGAEQSYDIEKDMKNILTYFGTLNKRDTVLTKLIDDIDTYLKAHPNEKGEEIEKLKNIRDGLVLRDVQLAVLSGDPDQVKSATSHNLLNPSNLKVYYGEANLNNVLTAEQLNSVNSTGSLNSVVSNQSTVGFIILDHEVVNAVNAVTATSSIGSFSLPSSVVSDMHNIGNVTLSGVELSNVVGAVTSVNSYVNSMNTTLNNITEPL
jgi:hypothetical protein